MRILQLVVHGFGPFAERRFDLAPGLSVFHGPNEAGKSTLLAALLAALCGVRRGRGRNQAQGEIERHRPWNGTAWRLRVRLRLADGREVEIVQDLDDKSRCKAYDAQLGGEVTSEILRDGALEPAAWLGLDREAFLATACVRQSELLRLRERPEAVRELLQRAALPAGVDATAAQALARIAAALKEHVGARMVTSTKPLQRSLVRAEEAQAALDAARRRHTSDVELLSREDALASRRANLDRDLERARAAVVAQAAGRARRELERARFLAGRHPQEPAGLVANDALALEVDRAMRAYDSRPEARAPVGATSDELRAELASIEAEPLVAVGSPVPVRPVVVAIASARAVRAEASPARAAASVSAAPVAASKAPAPTLETEPAPEVLRAAERLRTARAVLAEHERREPRTLEPTPRPARRSGRTVWAGAALTVAGSAVIASSDGLSGTWMWLSILALVVAFGLWAARRGMGAAAESRRFETRLAGVLTNQFRTWEARRDDLRAAAGEHENDLRRLLAARGLPVGADPLADVPRYEARCRLAARKRSVRDRLDQRTHEEESYRTAQDERAAAERAVGALAARLGLAAVDAAAARRALAAWSTERSRALAEREAELREWTELAGLLAGRSLEDLETSSRGLEAQVQASPFSAADLAAIAADEPTLARLDAEHRKVDRELAELRGEIRERESTAPRLAEIEAELRVAVEERDRVLELERTLLDTQNLLQQAQERVHRDVAPVLAAALRAALPRVTSRRWTDARVDPATLEVHVFGQDGEWRPATALSHGTCEQVYLLLRVAMARHLVRPPEVCPLLLDDVTVQSDGDRTRALLDLLHAESRDRQIVLFTQEDEVLDWARAHLQPPADALVPLAAG